MRIQTRDCQQQQHEHILGNLRKPPEYFGAREFRVDPKQRRSSIDSTHAHRFNSSQLALCPA